MADSEKTIGVTDHHRNSHATTPAFIEINQPIVTGKHALQAATRDVADHRAATFAKTAYIAIAIELVFGSLRCVAS